MFVGHCLAAYPGGVHGCFIPPFCQKTGLPEKMGMIYGIAGTVTGIHRSTLINGGDFLEVFVSFKADPV